MLIFISCNNKRVIAVPRHGLLQRANDRTLSFSPRAIPFYSISGYPKCFCDKNGFIAFILLEKVRTI